MNRVPEWRKVAPLLVDVATGRQPADLVFKNGIWVNVYSGELIPATDIAIVAGRFAYVGPDADHCIGKDTTVIDAAGRYFVPGLCDAHMHIESGMLTVTQFVRAVAVHGSTSLFVDPHEIANVLGVEGVRLMHDEALQASINVFVQAPSCVPSAPGLETAGAELNAEHIAAMMQWPNIIGLGEVMNFPGVANNDARMVGEIAATVAAGKTVGGHYASPVLDNNFHGYVAGGPSDDHEGTREEDAIARVRQGMRAMLRLGSAWYDVEKQITAVTEKGLDPRNFILCTDDSHAGTIVNDGHMNRVVKHAIECGLEPVTAIQMATLNTAQHFGLERELGSIAPGRLADLLLVEDLPSLAITDVYARGQHLAADGKLLKEISSFDYPDFCRDTVKLGKQLKASDFDVVAPEGAEKVRVRVIGVVENQAPTRALEEELGIVDGLIAADAAKDVCHIALVERHRATGEVVNAFVSGFGYKSPCAMASTVAHDSHHMIVIGTNKDDMALAANRLGEVGGGVTFFSNGVEKAMIEMPIAGLMSDKPAETVAGQAERLVQAMADCGCEVNNAYMQHSLLALVVIPELRISDLGLVDVTRFEKVDLIVS